MGFKRLKQKKKTWRDELDERMMRLRYSDESMIHFKKSNNYLNIHKINFKNNDDDVNGLVEIDESIVPIKDESN